MNPMISYTDSCNCSDSSDIDLSDEWVAKSSPKLSRGNRSPERMKNRFFPSQASVRRHVYVSERQCSSTVNSEDIAPLLKQMNKL